VTHSLRGEGFDASEDGTGRGTPLVPVAFSFKDYGNDAADDLSPTLRSLGAYDANGGSQMAVAFPILEAGARTGVSTTDPRAGMGIGSDGDPMFTLQAGKQHAVAFDLRGRDGGAQFEGPHDTANIRAASGGSSRSYVAAFAENSRGELRLEGGDGSRVGAISTGGGKPGQGSPTIMAGYAVRRLTPVECERLQGFPDDYTAVPYRGKVAADGPRYKSLGNSMAVPVMRWIGERIQSVEEILRAQP
jgi:DNA (cytosine-5)-methyltransferase 1